MPPLPEEPPVEISLWLTNPERSRWLWLWVPLLFLGIPVLEAAILALYPQAFWGMLMVGLLVIIVAIGVLSKRNSDPATVRVTAAGLTVRSDVAIHNLTIAFHQVQDYTYTSIKGGSALRIDCRDGTSVRLRAAYRIRDFGKMAAEFERRYKQYELQLRLARPRPRR